MGDVPFDRQYNARPIDTFRDLGCGNSNHAAMPTFARDYSAKCRVVAGAFEFADCQLDYLLLDLFALVVPIVEMPCQPRRFVFVGSAK
jgi:hypothetical protein